jgi:hypothetical protein
MCTIALQGKAVRTINMPRIIRNESSPSEGDSDPTTRNSWITAALGKQCAMVANSVLMSALVDHKSTLRGSVA